MKYIVACLLLLVSISSVAQKKHGRHDGVALNIYQNFCNTLMGLVYQVPDSFKEVRGKKVDESKEPTYRCKYKVTGVDHSRIRNINGGWLYQGLIHSDTSVSITKGYYEEYAAHLRSCLPNDGYRLVEIPNTVASLQDFPDLLYRHSTAAISIFMKVSKSSETGANVIEVFMTR